MRSNGLATILLMIPVLTVPALAIFGIPQFAPVVASPLDEGRDHDREARVGNSASLSRDELFGDVEGFGSEPDGSDEIFEDRRNKLNRPGPAARIGTKSSKDVAKSSWGDDLNEDTGFTTSNIPRSNAAGSRPAEIRPVLSQGRNPKRFAIGDTPTQNPRRAMPTTKRSNGVQLASATDENESVAPANFFDDGDADRGQAMAPYQKKSSRSEESRPSKRRELASEPLTWQSAVEKLNEFEIRSFRLEPGHQLGHFVFICSYTPPDTPRVSHRFEADADEPLKAVEKVLEQIVEWQKRR
ncbi:hypothetical protein [Schlesneria paludicola]|uniref:hypothetical protein n=1 Tax=Schlesneria paludicola TaxID=360056 RepID=UPI000299CF64|nr:hypothetical protein [Schlesneria paludicola]